MDFLTLLNQLKRNCYLQPVPDTTCNTFVDAILREMNEKKIVENSAAVAKDFFQNLFDFGELPNPMSRILQRGFENKANLLQHNRRSCALLLAAYQSHVQLPKKMPENAQPFRAKINRSSNMHDLLTLLGNSDQKTFHDSAAWDGIVDAFVDSKIDNLLNASNMKPNEWKKWTLNQWQNLRNEIVAAQHNFNVGYFLFIVLIQNSTDDACVALKKKYENSIASLDEQQLLQKVLNRICETDDSKQKYRFAEIVALSQSVFDANLFAFLRKRDQNAEGLFETTMRYNNHMMLIAELNQVLDQRAVKIVEYYRLEEKLNYFDQQVIDDIMDFFDCGTMLYKWCELVDNSAGRLGEGASRLYYFAKNCSFSSTMTAAEFICALDTVPPISCECTFLVAELNNRLCRFNSLTFGDETGLFQVVLSNAPTYFNGAFGTKLSPNASVTVTLIQSALSLSVDKEAIQNYSRILQCLFFNRTSVVETPQVCEIPSRECSAIYAPLYVVLPQLVEKSFEVLQKQGEEMAKKNHSQLCRYLPSFIPCWPNIAKISQVPPKTVDKPLDCNVFRSDNILPLLPASSTSPNIASLLLPLPSNPMMTAATKFLPSTLPPDMFLSMLPPSPNLSAPQKNNNMAATDSDEDVDDKNTKSKTTNNHDDNGKNKTLDGDGDDDANSVDDEEKIVAKITDSNNVNNATTRQKRRRTTNTKQIESDDDDNDSDESNESYYHLVWKIDEKGKKPWLVLYLGFNYLRDIEEKDAEDEKDFQLLQEIAIDTQENLIDLVPWSTAKQFQEICNNKNVKKLGDVQWQQLWCYKYTQLYSANSSMTEKEFNAKRLRFLQKHVKAYWNDTVGRLLHLHSALKWDEFETLSDAQVFFPLQFDNEFFDKMDNEANRAGATKLISEKEKQERYPWTTSEEYSMYHEQCKQKEKAYCFGEGTEKERRLKVTIAELKEEIKKERMPTTESAKNSKIGKLIVKLLEEKKKQLFSKKTSDNKASNTLKKRKNVEPNIGEVVQQPIKTKKAKTSTAATATETEKSATFTSEKAFRDFKDFCEDKGIKFIADRPLTADGEWYRLCRTNYVDPKQQVPISPWKYMTEQQYQDVIAPLANLYVTYSDQTDKILAAAGVEFETVDSNRVPIDNVKNNCKEFLAFSPTRVDKFVNVKNLNNLLMKV